MAKFKITGNDIELLELKTDEAYKMLKRAVKTQPLLIPTAECLYEHDLRTHIPYKAENMICLRKGGKRAKPVEKFILQCILMHKEDSVYDDGKHQMSITEDPNDGMGGLKAYLDAEDDPNSEKAEVFKLVNAKAADLRNKGRYDLILKALDYVREKY